jgi:hypothetical protein
MTVTVKLVSAPKAWTNPRQQARAVFQEFKRSSPALQKAAVNIVKDRVQQEGVGPDGKVLVGYSTRPTRVQQLNELKPKRRPRGGRDRTTSQNRNNWTMLYEGGYKEYRQKIGLRADAFYFSNFGTAWRHFGTMYPSGFVREGAGFRWRLYIGFRRQEDQVAAADAEIKRPGMFTVGPREAAAYCRSILAPKFFDAMKLFFT